MPVDADSEVITAFGERSSPITTNLQMMRAPIIYTARSNPTGDMAAAMTINSISPGIDADHDLEYRARWPFTDALTPHYGECQIDCELVIPSVPSGIINPE